MDYYKLLNIEPGANEATIRRAYRRQALKYHPDKNKDPAAIDRFREINNALEQLLKNPELNLNTPTNTWTQDDSVWADEILKAKKFREELYAKQRQNQPKTPKVSEKLLQQLAQKNARLRRSRRSVVTKACRTVVDGPVFSTVAEAREYVDTHPETRLAGSYFRYEYSEEYEEYTLNRAARVLKR